MGGPHLWLAGHQGFQASDPGISISCLTHFCPAGPSCSLSTQVCFLGLCQAPVLSLLPAPQGRSESSSGKGSVSRHAVHSHFFTSKTFSHLKSPSSSPASVNKEMGPSMAPLVGPEVPSTSEWAKPKTPRQGLTLVFPDRTGPCTTGVRSTTV